MDYRSENAPYRHPDDISTKLLNEATVLIDSATLMPNSIKAAFTKITKDPAELATKFAIGGSLGLTLGFLSKCDGKIGLAAKAFGTVAGVAFVAEGLKPINRATSIAWHAQNDNDLRIASQTLSDGLSMFLVDTAIQTPVAITGAYAGSALKTSLFSKSAAASLESSALAPAGGPDVRLSAQPVASSAMEARTLSIKQGEGNTSTGLVPELTISDSTVCAQVGPRSLATGGPAGLVEVASPTAGTVPPFLMPKLEVAAETKVLSFKFAESTSKSTVATADLAIGVQPTQQGGLILQPRNSYTRAAIELPENQLPSLDAVVALPANPSTDTLIATAILANRSAGRRVDPHIVEFLVTGKKPSPSVAEKTRLEPRVEAIRGVAESTKGPRKRIAQLQNILEGQLPEISVVARVAGNQSLIPRSMRATNIQNNYALAKPEVKPPLAGRVEPAATEPIKPTSIETLNKPSANIDGHDISRLMRKPAGPQPLRFTVTTVEKPQPFDFGVEITEPKLLRPGQTNLDHHGTSATSETLSAIEQAIALPEAKLPKPGTTLGTVKPDADSVGGMAVLCARLEGKQVDAALVSCIGRRDRGLLPPGTEPPKYTEAMNAASWFSLQNRFDLTRRVELVKRVLTGEIEQSILAKLSRDVETSRARALQKAEASVQITTDPTNRIAFVTGPSKQMHVGKNLGLESADVAIAQPDNRSGYFQIITRSDSQASRYMPRAMNRLQALEPGWRGKPQFMLSPETNSRFSIDEVASIISPYINPSRTTRLMWNAQDYLKGSISRLPQLNFHSYDSLPMMGTLYATSKN